MVLVPTSVDFKYTEICNVCNFLSRFARQKKDSSRFFSCLQRSSNKCIARTMDEDVTRLSIHSDEPKIILHGSGN